MVVYERLLSFQTIPLYMLMLVLMAVNIFKITGEFEKQQQQRQQPGNVSIFREWTELLLFLFLLWQCLMICASLFWLLNQCFWCQHALQLNLPEGVSIDIVVSAIVNAGHIFVQQPTHPTFPSLERLSHFMNACYSDQNAPMLPRPVEGNFFSHLIITEAR